MRNAKRTAKSYRKPDVKEIDTLVDYFGKGRMDEAKVLALFLLKKFPKHASIWKILGAVYLEHAQYTESSVATRKAIALAPDDAASHNNLGIALLQLGQLPAAESSVMRAVSIAPCYAKALSNLSNILRKRGDFSGAEKFARRALISEPHFANAHVALGNSLELQSRLSEARGCYRAAIAINPDLASIHTDLLYLLSLDVHTTPQELFAEHVAFGEHFEPPLRTHWQPHTNSKNPARCLQVGFVSGDLYDHAVASFLEPVLKYLSKSQSLSLHAYYTHVIEDPVNKRLQSYFSHWNAIAQLSDENLANKIRADGIDILIDLSSHTAHNRLLTCARKPAPVQATWMGYPGTTGLQAIDYHLCDRFYVPPGELDWQFTEKSAILPASAIFQPSEQAPAVNPLPALDNGFITFGSFNRPNKLNASVVALWAMLLRDLPDAKMVFGGIPAESQLDLFKQFSDEGIAPDRLTFFPRANLPEYLALHHQVDICLDTFPYAGGTTTFHAAWMGVPTLTLIGETPPSRSGGTIMNQLGLDGFIATSIEDFVAKGQYWANHTSELATIRLEMRDRFNASAMGRPEQFSKHLEAALREMWKRWCQQLPIETIDFAATSNSIESAEYHTKREPSHQELENLAILYNEKHYAEAASLSRRLVERYPEHGFAWKILGSVLHAQGHLDESLKVQQRTVELRPDDHEAHFNLACEYHQQGLLEQAVKSYFSALAIEPNNAIAYSNLGNILKTLGHFSTAEECCRQAITLKPEMAYAHNNLGSALHAQGKLALSEASYRLALKLTPNWAEGCNNLAIALKDQGKWEEATGYYRQALSISPNWAAAHSNMLYCLSLDVHTTPQDLFAEHVAFGDHFEAPLRAHWQPHANIKDPARCLQIGFVSGDLYDHAVASFLEPVLKFLANSQNLNLHAYYTHVIEDPVNKRLQSYFSHWNAIAQLSDENLANKIRADGIDILIDLSSHTAHNRLLTFARKPAPVQATWMGYPGTTGLKAMDYHLCDRFWIPPCEIDWQFTEKSAFLPVSAIFQPSEHAPAVSGLPALKNGYITFASFNRTNKINASVLVLWSMLLRSLPCARMLLAAVPPDSQDALIRSFADEGIEPDRLIFYPRASMADYLALHHQVDICLDTFPYSGGTTIHHAAWMGVPTLTLSGETPASRAGASEMHFWGLDGFIADSIDDFISKGRYWAGQFSELAAIRASTRARLAASPLGQHEPYAASFERILRTMWLRWCNSLPAALIDVGTTNP